MKSTLAISAIIFTVGFVTLPVVFSDSDSGWREYEYSENNIGKANNPVYKQECGSCHMAYPPGLLPSASWSRMMDGLEDHFGDNAELDAETHKTISEFLSNNSADNSDYRRSRKFMKNIDASNAPLRITETPYFKHEHEEIPGKMIAGNEKVKSLSQCSTCHKKAEQGRFDEDDVNIPGYGRWDD